ncbi:MAG: MMPL family transporter [Thermodesulfobacteriota bacterium]
MALTPKSSRFESLVEKLSRFFESLGAFTYDHRAIVLILTLALLGISIFFLNKVRFDTSFESFFSREDPNYAQYLQFRDDFGSDEIAYILYTVPGKAHGAWDLEAMKQIAHLTRTLEKEVPFVKEVTSLANAEFIEGRGDELLIHEVLEPFPQSQEELLDIRSRVMKKPLLVGTLTSADGRHGAIIMDMQKSAVDQEKDLIFDPARGPVPDNLYPEVSNNAIERILARPEYGGLQFYLTGDVVLNTVYNRTTREESARLGLIAILVIGGLLFFFFRRPLGALGPLAVVTMAVMVSTAFAGMMGWKLDLMYSMLPLTIITVGVASSVHILTEYTVNYKKMKDKRAAIRKTMLMLGTPCLFTMLTDMAGFGSTNVSSIKSLQHFAWYSSLGVLAAFVLTVTVFLSVLTLFKVPSSSVRAIEGETEADGDGMRQRHFSIRFFAALSDFDVRHPWKITIAWMIFFALLGVGMTYLKVDSNFLNELSTKLKVRTDTEYVDAVMLGAGGLSYVFDSGEPDGVSDPEFLRRLERFQNRVNEETFIIMKTMSIVDLVKDINQAFHNEDTAYYVLPESRELIAQYLLLYEMAGGEKIRDYIASDWQRVNLEVHGKLLTSSIYKQVTDDLNRFLESGMEPAQRPVLTGTGFLWIKLIQYIVDSQVMGFSVAFVVISIMMCLVLGSLRIGLLAMIPNVAPVFVTLGIMGWLGIPLDYVKLLIASIAIGIAVDDTLHFIMRYRLEFWRLGSYRLALEAALNDVGRSIFITTVVLLSGFAINMLSKMTSYAEFGFLTLVTLTVAAVADYFLTPALIIIFKAFGPEREPRGGQ